MQGSGTYAIEAALTGSAPKNSKLLILANGVYGDRMAEIARYAGLNHAVLTFEQTETPSVMETERFLQQHTDTFSQYCRRALHHCAKEC